MTHSTDTCYARKHGLFCAECADEYSARVRVSSPGTSASADDMLAHIDEAIARAYPERSAVRLTLDPSGPSYLRGRFEGKAS
jgi:hypothetical protein